MEETDSLQELREVVKSVKKKRPEKLPKCKIIQSLPPQEATSAPHTPSQTTPQRHSQSPIPIVWDNEPVAQTSDQGPAQIGEFLQWIMKTVQPPPTHREPKKSTTSKRKAHVTLSHSSESEEGQASDTEGEELCQESDSSDHSQLHSESDSENENPTPAATPEIAKRLLREMMQTLEIKDETTVLSKADRLLGVHKKSKLTFPIFHSITQAIETEWSQPDRRIALTQRFFKTYPVPEEHQKKWDKAPKVDSAVARLSRYTALPAEEAAFKDPLDRRMESILKKSYTQAAAMLRPAAASAGLARTAKHWAQELARHPPETKQQLQGEVERLSTAIAFLADASMEVTKLAAKTTANVVVARRALWLRHWTGDTASKLRLLSLKFTGDSLFGPDLKQIISEVTGGKSTFLPTGKRPRSEPNNRYTGKRSWSSQSRPFRSFRTYNKNPSTEQTARRGRQNWQQQARNTRKPISTKPNSA
ncbi:uncharacterized protein LOC121394150 isoform X2 [Xenopus laevis]|uniref:Uncharacterized protein LOC121394150 isoform X2 n=1 Tax=Xenopus laevis TaxID=8355 RepID=A0A8J1KS52_XENLA|nr:uncharacterized protein LOC121394150 isoform X2 [Xenopus laevis]